MYKVHKSNRITAFKNAKIPTKIPTNSNTILVNIMLQANRHNILKGLMHGTCNNYIREKIRFIDATFTKSTIPNISKRWEPKKYTWARQ